VSVLSPSHLSPAPAATWTGLRRLVLLPVLTLALLTAACLLGPVADASAATRTQRVARAANIALQQVGDPYRYGATGPGAFDCSGLMQYSFRKAGISLPRTAAAQSHRAHRISKGKLRRGDLMFFTDGGGVYHVAMFIKRSKGRIRMLHAPGSGKRVRMDSPWTSHWFAGSVR
jgi:cell wall-associated NlpC family hydrolase